MSYRLRMTGEIRGWLSEIRLNDPPAARCAAEAIVAVLTRADQDALPGQPLLADLAAQAPAGAELPGSAADALDDASRRLPELLRPGRRELADAAAAARRADRLVPQVQETVARLAALHERAVAAGREGLASETDAQLAEARAQLAQVAGLARSAAAAERRLRERLQRAEARVAEFRARADVARSRYAAVSAERASADAGTATSAAARTAEETAAAPAAEETAAERDQPSSAGAPGERSAGTDERSAAEAALRGLLADVRELATDLAAELGDPGAATLPERPAPAAGLLELHPGAPDDCGIRILCAIEPADSLTLLAVLDGASAVASQRDTAIDRASALLLGLRAGGWPELPDEADFSSAESFLAEVFPGEAAAVTAGAAALADRIRPRGLAELRAQAGLSQAQVARRMGVRQERVSAIERAAAGAIELRTLAAYLAALGGRLQITADLGSERVLLG